MDNLTKEQRRRNMQAIRSVGNTTESMFAKELYKKGIRYRRNSKYVIGRPDISIKKYKIAIFIDGEFWHGKNWDKRKKDIKTNLDYWIPKIERNIERDKEVNNTLINTGWKVFRFWSKRIKKDLTNCVNAIEKTVNEAKRRTIN